ncbi:heterokaryon incompatibility protein-domain-containing protein [Lenzites betulinus]|nr:heterokaryon incompatibility protein-domain-containing protein [Lenzites betulinus]
MPRFLDTYTGQFVWLADVGTTPYAILSHTWRSDTDGGEQTYDDILKLQSAYPPSTQNQQNVYPPPLNEPFFSHPGLSEKIQGICAVARRAGYRLIWIDSCCIDKRSSAELTEAINSMYSLYRDANVCYVYLADVPDGADPRDTGDDSPFKNSRWHKRGWTLQELIAPARVVFLSRNWMVLGTKTSLASTLEAITRVDVAILTGMVPLDSASVAKRMSWAAGRETTRVEDRAYSLLGIFKVHMSPIYGEGANAFLRLQEEIIKHIPDQSVFAWGTSRNPLEHYRRMCRGPLVLSEVGLGLLATSPNVFEDAGDVSPISTSTFATYIGRDHDFALPPLHCVFTPQGVRIGLVLIPLTALHGTVRVLHKAPMASFSSVDEEVELPLPLLRSLAILRCQDKEGKLIVLPLRYSENDVGRAENVMVGAHWHVMCPFKQWHSSTRVIRLPPDVLKAPDVVATSMCADTSILRHYEEPRAPKTHRDGFSKAGWTDPRHPGDGKQAIVRFAPECVEELRTLGFALAPLDCQCSQEDIVLTTTLYCAPRDPLRDYEMKRGPSARIHFRLSDARW